MGTRIITAKEARKMLNKQKDNIFESQAKVINDKINMALKDGINYIYLGNDFRDDKLMLLLDYLGYNIEHCGDNELDRDYYIVSW